MRKDAKMNKHESSEWAHMQLLYLLKGLEVPDPVWWTAQNPEALCALGKAIANQAKRVGELLIVTTNT